MAVVAVHVLQRYRRRVRYERGMEQWRKRSCYASDHRVAAPSPKLRGPSRRRSTQGVARRGTRFVLTPRRVAVGAALLAACTVLPLPWIRPRPPRRSHDSAAGASEAELPRWQQRRQRWKQHVGGATNSGASSALHQGESNRRGIRTKLLSDEAAADRTEDRRSRRRDEDTTPRRGGGASAGAGAGTGVESGQEMVEARSFSQKGGVTGLPTGERGWKSDGPSYPPLDELIDDTTTRARNQRLRSGVDASFLLDFAVVGFAKCGTTAIMRHLSSAADILRGERCDLVVNETGRLVTSLYRELPQSLGPGRRLRGLKCPQDLSSELSLPNYAAHFPRTKLVVGIRHPLFFFESLYNFRVMTLHWKELLPANNLTRRCISGSLGVCGWRAEFADFLARLGKTFRDEREERLLKLHLPSVPGGVGDVFLYELSQLSDEDGGRSAAFRKDLATFLGLGGGVADSMPPIPRIGLESVLLDQKKVGAKKAEGRKIDICDETHWKIREVLLEKAQRASVWLRTYFLPSEGVTVSSRPHLVEILKGWMRDPCMERKKV